MSEPKRIVLGISGASGVALGIEALKQLRAANGVETHLIMSRASLDYAHYESLLTAHEITALADFYYRPDQLDAAIASGSFKTHAMVVLPCAMKTLAGLATGYSDNLLLRAGDVHLKERRPLILAVRETPLSYIHLKNMETLALAGAVIMPPMVTFYHKPASVAAMTAQIVARILEKAGVENPEMYRWASLPSEA